MASTAASTRPEHNGDEGGHSSLSRCEKFRSPRMQSLLRKLPPRSQTHKSANSEMREQRHLLSMPCTAAPSTGSGATRGDNPKLLAQVTKGQNQMGQHRGVEHLSNSSLRALSRPRNCPEHSRVLSLGLRQGEGRKMESRIKV